MDSNILLSILGELRSAATAPQVTHEVTASGLTYVIYRKRQISNVDGYLVMRVSVVTTTVETTIIKTAFLPWLEGISTYDIEIYNATLISELSSLQWG